MYFQFISTFYTLYVVQGELPTPSSEDLADQNLVPAEVYIVKICHKRRKVPFVI